MYYFNNERIINEVKYLNKDEYIGDFDDEFKKILEKE
jgi:hypothetical protein